MPTDCDAEELSEQWMLADDFSCFLQCVWPQQGGGQQREETEAKDDHCNFLVFSPMKTQIDSTNGSNWRKYFAERSVFPLTLGSLRIFLPTEACHMCGENLLTFSSCFLFCLSALRAPPPSLIQFHDKIWLSPFIDTWNITDGNCHLLYLWTDKEQVCFGLMAKSDTYEVTINSCCYKGIGQRWLRHAKWLADTGC